MDLCFRDIEPVCTHVCVSIQVGERKEPSEDYFLSFSLSTTFPDPKPPYNHFQKSEEIKCS